MNSLFSRLRRRCAHRSRKPNSTIEALAPRVMLTSPPSIGLTVIANGPSSVEVTGMVMDDSDPAGLVVTISGVVSGTATVGDTGEFSLTATASGPGTVTAAVTDGDGETGEAETEFVDAPPEIMNFTVTRIDGVLWEVSGAISDEFPDGLVINLGGILPTGLSPVVGSDGTFNLQFTWTNPTTGLATASLDDWWSQTSEAADAFVLV